MVLMNTEIQKKVKERQNKKQKQSMKGQSSIEYPMMIAIALIVIALAIVVILSVGGKTAKAGTIHAELLSAEVSTGNTLSIATNLPLTISANSGIGVNGTAVGTVGTIKEYTVNGGYEYVIPISATGTMPKVGTPISDITMTSTSGSSILLLPASGTNVTVTSGTAPFSISNLGS